MKESYTNEQEGAPNIPDDPNEAANQLQLLWEKDQDFSVKTPKESRTSRAKNEGVDSEINEHNKKFEWLAKMFDSEIYWLHTKIVTNYGSIHCFRFSPQYDPIDKTFPPNAYIFYPNVEEKLEDGVFIQNTRDGWKRENLKDLNDKYLDLESSLY